MGWYDHLQCLEIMQAFDQWIWLMPWWYSTNKVCMIKQLRRFELKSCHAVTKFSCLDGLIKTCMVIARTHITGTWHVLLSEPRSGEQTFAWWMSPENLLFDRGGKVQIDWMGVSWTVQVKMSGLSHPLGIFSGLSHPFFQWTFSPLGGF